MNRWGALAAILIVAAALALRLPQLSLRPLHNDEAVNAIKVSELWEKGRYVYDPHEYHGPALHYATVPFLALSGARDSHDLPDGALRWVTVAFGIGLILLLPLLRGGLSPPALLWAAIFIAVSPAMVFYSRYFIHEMPLVFFTALTIGAGWRYMRARDIVRSRGSGDSNDSRALDGPLGTAGPTFWAMVAGVGVGLMYATKETFVITMAAVACGAVGAHLLRSAATYLTALIKLRHLALAFAAFLAIWVLFFTSFFTNWPGLGDSISAYFPWLKRAGGHSPHIHPWYFYLQRLAWFHPAKGPIFSEALIVGLAFIGGLTALVRRKPGLHCFLAVYTIALTAAYTIIPYKTPWCLLSFHHGMILLAGIGAVAVIEFFRSRSMKALMLVALGAFTIQLGWQSWRANFIFFADRRNPYVYAQTLPDLVQTAAKIEAIARVSPEGYKTIIKVVTPDGDYWPLPWYLRRFERAGWYDKPPEDPFAPIILVSQKLEAALDERSGKKWIMVGYTELRPQRFLELYVEIELWKKFVATLPPVRDE